MRAKRVLWTAVAAAAMAACGGDANAPEDQVDGLGPNVSAPIDLPDTFNGGSPGGGGTVDPAQGVSPSCGTEYLQGIILEGPSPCNRR